jgi:mannosylglucosylglycerate synthase
MNKPTKTAILHYTASPIIGGVESVITAHTKVFLEHGYPIKVIAGRGKKSALPDGAEFTKIPLLDSQHPRVLKVNQELAQGTVSDSYNALCQKITSQLEKALEGIENVIAHNLFSKHFNLAFTEALVSLQEEGKIPNAIAWCHDFSVQSKNDQTALYDGLPWDILRTYNPNIHYVTISRKRQEILAKIFEINKDKINVIYNGLDPDELLGISSETEQLIGQLGLLEADLILLMPVRITKAKNIEFAMQVASELQAKDCSFKILLTGPPDPHDSDNMAYFRSLKKMRQDLGLVRDFKFLYEENPKSAEPYILDMRIVAELYRVCDLVFMPSHHEGFGLPVLEAGFIGKPIFSTKIPASVEIGEALVHLISLSSGPEAAAQKLLSLASRDPIHQFRVRTRKNFTWQRIFSNQIKPLLVD